MLHTLAVLALLAPLAAVDSDIRLIPQVLGGSSGFEPGVALEVRSTQLSTMIIRPEIFLSDDGDLGGGAALLWDVSKGVGLHSRQALAIGPRVVHHNAKESGWEADVMATWGFDLSGDLDPWRHSIGLIGAVGVVNDPDHDDNELGVSGGAFYAYRF